MIAAVLDRVGAFFDRAFVVSALFPALIAAFVAGVTLMTVLGFDSSFLWFDGLSGSAKTALTTTASGGLLLVAFLIRALRANILSLWSGEFLSEQAALIGVVSRLRQRRRYDRLLA